MWIPYLIVIGSHAFTLNLLAAQRTRQQPYSKISTKTSPWPLTLSAVLSAALTIAVVVRFPSNDPLLDAGLRAAAFFYAIKILDLGITHVDHPPTKLERKGESQAPVSMSTVGARAVYVWALLSETRYFSFDIAVQQPGRNQGTEEKRGTVLEKWKSWATAGNLLPALLIPSLTWIWPVAELNALLLLLAIQLAFEAAHAVFHPWCDEPLFDRPFTAASMSEFWASRWHAFASSTLRNLAYSPVRKRFGRVAGVLSTFALSGVWHAFAAVVVSDSTRLPWLVFGIFVLFGVVCVAEKAIWGQSQGGIVQRIVVWSVAVMAAGYCFRELQCHSRIAIIKIDCPA